MEEELESEDQVSEAFRAGRRTGFGIAGLALSLVSFLSLLGFEKAILAIVLGSLAMQAAPPRSLARRLGIGSISLAMVFIITAIVLLFLFREHYMELLRTLRSVS